MIKVVIILISILIPNQFHNMPVELIQPNGEILNCFVSGDEFYKRLHDVNNYTIIQSDEDGYYYYATKDNGIIKPTSFRALYINPENKNLNPNIKISQNEYLDRRNRYFMM